MTEGRMWSAPEVTELRWALAEIFPREPDQRRFVEDLGLRPGTIAFDASAENAWFAIVQRARQTVGLDALLWHALGTDEGRDHGVLRRIAAAGGARQDDAPRGRAVAAAAEARALAVPCRVLFLASDPEAARRLELGTELRAVREEIERSGRGSRFDLHVRPDLRLDDLRRSLNAIDPSIVHFGGHGGGESGLLFHDDAAGAKPVGAEALRGLFALTAAPVRLVVLNACYSATQARALVGVVDCVVGMGHVVEDAAACRFAAALYGALAAGRSVENAFAQGLWVMKHDPGGGGRAAPGERDVEALAGPGRTSDGAPNTPQLLVRPGVDAGAIVFAPSAP